MSLEVVVVPCLEDNYAYLLHDDDCDGGHVALVDAPDAAPIHAALQQRGWTLSQILLTHHHHDHVQGVSELVQHYGCEVIGAKADAQRLPPLDTVVSDGDHCQVGSLSAQVIDVSGHTRGHIAFVLPGKVFTGDSLMALGCGRLFEGSPEQAWAGLERLSALAPETLVYSGHNYGAANARFALQMEPDNQALQERQARIAALDAKGEPIVPVSIGEELATNPFLRPHSASIRASVKADANSPSAEVFGRVRAAKDKF